MPVRQIPLVTGHYYHVYTRGVARLPIFQSRFDYQYMVYALDYYRYKKPMVKLSKFIHLPQAEQEKMRQQMDANQKLVSITAFTLMPNHLHIMLQQLQDGGIVTYMRRALNSYARYFNTKRKRVGPLFQGVYKSIHIDSDEQLLHLSRYIHINPVVSGVIDEKNLLTYEWSSLPMYMGSKPSFVDTEIILKQFTSTESYLTFLKDHVDYGKKLADIKHITLENDGFPDFPEV